MIVKPLSLYSVSMHVPKRSGDILHSLADLSKAARLIDYTNLTDLPTGLAVALEWYKK